MERSISVQALCLVCRFCFVFVVFLVCLFVCGCFFCGCFCLLFLLFCCFFDMDSCLDCVKVRLLSFVAIQCDGLA